MDFGQLLMRRRMVRRYTAEPVDPKAVERILDRSRRHPTAGFTQGIHFVLVTDDRDAIAAAGGEDSWVDKGYEPWLSQAPVLVVICAIPDRYRERYAEADKASDPDSWPVPYWWVDAGAALMLTLLSAADEGLAAGFLGVHAFEEHALHKILGLPESAHPIGVVSIGHAAHDPVEGSRKRGRIDTIHREHW